jgi:hypothetical protein
LEELLQHVVNQGGYFVSGGRGANLTDASKKMGLDLTKRVDPSLNVMRKDLQQLGGGDVYVYQGHAGTVNGEPSVAAYKGGSANPGTPGVEGTWGGRQAVDAVTAKDMVRDITKKGSAPALAFIGGCQSAQDFANPLIQAGVGVVIASGGGSVAGVQKDAQEAFFNSLAAGKTVGQALATANAYVQAYNKANESNEELDELKGHKPMTPFKASYGKGLSEKSTWKDIR